MASVVRVKLDGTDVTNVAIAGSWTPRLNRPAQAQITIPMDAAIGDVGSRLKIELDTGSGYNIVFHGFVLNTETDTNKDQGTTVYNAQDPMELWQWRPVRDDDGDFSKPTNFIERCVYAPSMVEATLQNTVDTTSGGGGAPPTYAEGPIFLDMGTFASGSDDCRGAPTDWPMTIAQFFSLLCSTGTVDVVITPTDPGGGVMGTVDGYAGDYGTDLSGSVIFQYGTGAHNVDSLRWNRDMTNVVNKYWLYAGPRVQTPADPAGDQHWNFNVTGDDAGLPGYPASPPYSTVITRRSASQSAVGVRMKVDIFDASEIDPNVSEYRALYRRQWIEYSYIMSTPREIIHVTPTRDTALGTFGIGDLVAVEASTDVRGGFSGAQRVYEYTVSWDQDSVLALSELQTSSDAEF